MIKIVRDGFREWSVEELFVEIVISVIVVSIYGEDLGIVYLRWYFDMRYVIVEWEEVILLVEVWFIVIR